MQKTLLFFALLCCTQGLWAQVTINNSIFPRAGAILQISTAVDTPVAITAAGNTAQTWDFRMLRTAQYREDSIVGASSGLAFAQFPNAEIIEPLVAGFGTAYVDVTTASVTRIGAGAELFVISLVQPYSNPQTMQIAPLNYLASFNDSYQLNFGIAIDSIPFLRQLIDTVAGGMIPGGVSPDSLRLKLSGQRRTRVDAFGQCQMPDSTHQVLRQKVTDINNFAIEARVSSPFGGGGIWIDITTFLGGSLPIPIPETDTAVYYNFLINNSIEPLVRLYTDNAGTTVERIEFKGQYRDTTTSVRNLDWQVQARFYPNPTTDQLFIDLGAYDQAWGLVVVDLSGKTCFQQAPQYGAQRQVSLGDLPKGLYGLMLINERGEKLGQSKLLLK